jgi:hypothetical protein
VQERFALPGAKAARAANVPIRPGGDFDGWPDLLEFHLRRGDWN